MNALSSKRGLPMVVTVMSACAIAACTTTSNRTAAERAADAEIARRVEAALSADPNIYARHIDVEVNQGVVELAGYVWDSEDFQTARRDAASVAGVRRVNTDMELMRGGRGGGGR